MLLASVCSSFSCFKHRERSRCILCVVSGWSLPLSLTVFSDSYPWWLISCCLLEAWTLSSCSVGVYPDASQDRMAPEVSSSGEPRLSGNQLPWLVAGCTRAPRISRTGHPVLFAGADGSAPGWTVLAPGPGLPEVPRLSFLCCLWDSRPRMLRVRSPCCVGPG